MLPSQSPGNSPALLRARNYVLRYNALECCKKKTVSFLADHAGDICGKPLKIIKNSEPAARAEAGCLAA